MVEKDLEREAMRLELVRDNRIEDSKLRAVKELRQICDSDNVSEIFLNLFSKDGRPPKYVTMRSMIEQYELLESRRMWFIAFRKELLSKFKELDIEGYEQFLFEAEEEERLKKEQMDKAAKEYLKKNNRVLKPKVQESIRNTLLRSREVFAKKRKVDMDIATEEILGAKKIEKTMYYLFTEHIRNPKFKLVVEPKKRCEKITREVLWLDALIVEVEEGMIELNELIESAYLFLRQNSNVKMSPGDWRRFREMEVAETFVC